MVRKTRSRTTGYGNPSTLSASSSPTRNGAGVCFGSKRTITRLAWCYACRALVDSLRIRTSNGRVGCCDTSPGGVCAAHLGFWSYPTQSIYASSRLAHVCGVHPRDRAGYMVLAPFDVSLWVQRCYLERSKRLTASYEAFRSGIKIVKREPLFSLLVTSISAWIILANFRVMYSPKPVPLCWRVR